MGSKEKIKTLIWKLTSELFFCSFCSSEFYNTALPCHPFAFLPCQGFIFRVQAVACWFVFSFCFPPRYHSVLSERIQFGKLNPFLASPCSACGNLTAASFGVTNTGFVSWPDVVAWLARSTAEHNPFFFSIYFFLFPLLPSSSTLPTLRSSFVAVPRRRAKGHALPLLLLVVPHRYNLTGAQQLNSDSFLPVNTSLRQVSVHQYKCRSVD